MRDIIKNSRSHGCKTMGAEEIVKTGGLTGMGDGISQGTGDI